MLGIVIPLISSDANDFFNNFDCLVSSLENAKISNYHILIVYQTADLSCIPSFKNASIITTSIFSVSYARNLGIHYFKKNVKYIYFLDHDALPSVSFLAQSKINMANNLNVWSGSLSWTSPSYQNVSENFSPDFVLRGSEIIPFHQFLGCFIFKSSFIYRNDITFNQLIGPGRNTTLKAGEDVLFLAQFFSFNKITKFNFYRNLKIFHPPRSSDNLKSLLYCDGQVSIHKYLIFSDSFDFRIRLSAILFLFLFIVNAFKKILFLEKNSFTLLVKRISSFFKPYI